MVLSGGDLVDTDLDLAAGNQTRAAVLLNLSRDALRYRMKKFGIDIKQDVG